MLSVQSATGQKGQKRVKKDKKGWKKTVYKPKFIGYNNSNINKVSKMELKA